MRLLIKFGLPRSSDSRLCDFSTRVSDTHAAVWLITSLRCCMCFTDDNQLPQGGNATRIGADGASLQHGLFTVDPVIRFGRPCCGSEKQASLYVVSAHSYTDTLHNNPTDLAKSLEDFLSSFFSFFPFGCCFVLQLTRKINTQVNNSEV